MIDIVKNYRQILNHPIHKICKVQQSRTDKKTAPELLAIEPNRKTILAWDCPRGGGVNWSVYYDGIKIPKPV